MIRKVAILSVVVFAGFVFAGEPRPNSASDNRDGEKKTEAVLAVEKIFDTDEGKLVKLRLTNHSRESVQYSGYAPDMPRLMVEIKVAGKWERFQYAWCGTGAAFHPIEPGKSLEIEYSFPKTVNTYRVGLICQATPLNKDGMAWSEPISIDPNSKEQAEREKLDVVLVVDKIETISAASKNVKMRLTNNSKETIRYRGIGPDKPSLRVDKKFAGEWEIYRGETRDFSETYHPLKPGKSVSIEYSFPRFDETYRVGVIGEWTAAKRTGGICWSEAIEIKK
jgi:hypothetical protein